MDLTSAAWHSLCITWLSAASSHLFLPHILMGSGDYILGEQSSHIDLLCHLKTAQQFKTDLSPA